MKQQHKVRLSCADFWAGWGMPNCCCSSCHEDYDEGYEDLIEAEHPKNPNILARVCCSVMSTADNEELSTSDWNAALKEWKQKERGNDEQRGR